jgi:hypothetical protein
MYFHFFRKHKHKNKHKNPSFNNKGKTKNGLSKVQMMAISEAVLNKKRLLVFSETI